MFKIFVIVICTAIYLFSLRDHNMLESNFRVKHNLIRPSGVNGWENWATPPAGGSTRKIQGKQVVQGDTLRISPRTTIRDINATKAGKELYSRYVPFSLLLSVRVDMPECSTRDADHLCIT